VDPRHPVSNKWSTRSAGGRRQARTRPGRAGTGRGRGRGRDGRRARAWTSAGRRPEQR
jgi:hypothetical protein